MHHRYKTSRLTGCRPKKSAGWRGLNYAVTESAHTAESKLRRSVGNTEGDELMSTTHSGDLAAARRSLGINAHFWKLAPVPQAA